MAATWFEIEAAEESENSQGLNMKGTTCVKECFR
jgi:hypothetical protein